MFCAIEGSELAFAPGHESYSKDTLFVVFKLSVGGSSIFVMPHWIFKKMHK